MNHKWVKDKDFKPHDGIKSSDTCSMCGCTRTLMTYFHNSKVYHEYNYERSGMFMFNNRPDCLDWNDNTLD